MFTSDENILITGANGFVGSNIINQLINHENLNIIAISRTKSGLNGNIEYMKCDLTKENEVQSTLEKIEYVDRVLHLSALIPGKESLDTCEYINQNIISSINILKHLPESVKSFVYSSTIDVYGNPLINPINEKHPTNPVTDYGASKLSSEKFLKIGLMDKKIPLTILRYSQIYGLGEPIIKVIPSFINKIENNESPVIYGNGEDVRDYIFIEDVANITISALFKGVNGTFNIGTGKGIKIKEVLSLILEIYKTKLKVLNKPALKEPYESIYDISSSKNILGFNPSFEMKDGLKKMIYSKSSLGD